MADQLYLFSFGTLQDAAVQIGVFGRPLTGSADTLRGFTLGVLRITDPAVLALSGAAEHPLLQPSGDAADEVTGTVYAIDRADLLAADDYEVPDYGRITVTLASGLVAWVYLDRKHIAGPTFRPEI